MFRIHSTGVLVLYKVCWETNVAGIIKTTNTYPCFFSLLFFTYH